MTEDNKLLAGARNLLVNCLELDASDSLVIIYEDASFGWYDDEIPHVIADEANQFGVSPTLLKVGEPKNSPDPQVVKAIDDHNCIIFLARVGDQDRFADPLPGKKCVMCYARTAEMLASPYGQVPYAAMVQLKEAVNDILLHADKIEITCPLGTQISGSAPDSQREEPRDVAFKRFPLGVPMPIEASGFNGEVVLSRFLTPTGSKKYNPPNLQLTQDVTAKVINGRIADFVGPSEMVAKIKSHYEDVAAEFDIDADVIHSWHAGIHAGCGYDQSAGDDPDRWSNSVFTNPRVLHFHTCGAYGPGEICWMAVDHTVLADGKPLWENGAIVPKNFPQTEKCINTWPELAEILKTPIKEIGL